MKIEFRNDEYIKSAGKAPKGTGLWAFADKRNPNPMEVKFFDGTLTQAKGKAKDYYKKVGELTHETWMIIYVLP